MTTSPALWRSVTVSGHVIGTINYKLEVSDTGIGVSDEGIKKALSPFERPDEHGVNSQGIGLGLALSK